MRTAKKRRSLWVLVALLVLAGGSWGVLFQTDLMPNQRAAVNKFVKKLLATGQKGLIRGIVCGQDGNTALIDDQTVREGDSIYGATVVKIYADKVEFEKNGTRWTQGLNEIPGPQWRTQDARQKTEDRSPTPALSLPADPRGGRVAGTDDGTLTTEDTKPTSDLGPLTSDLGPPTSDEPAEVKAQAEAQATTQPEAQAKAKEQAQAEAAALVEAEARAKEQAEATAPTEAQANATTQPEAEPEAGAREQTATLAQADEEAKTQIETKAVETVEAQAKAQAQAQARAREQAEAKAQTQEATAKEQAEATAKAEEQARAREQADTKAKAQAEAIAQEQAEVRAEQEAEATAQPEAEAAAQAQAEAKRQKTEDRSPTPALSLPANPRGGRVEGTESNSPTSAFGAPTSDEQGEAEAKDQAEATATAEPPETDDVPQEKAAVSPEQPFGDELRAEPRPDEETQKRVIALISRLGDREPSVRNSVVTALGQIGPPAVGPLIVAMGAEDWIVRQGASQALGKIGDAQAVEPLTAALADKNQWIRRYAAEALGLIGDERAIEPLVAAMKDDSPGVRAVAAKALESIRGPSPGSQDKQAGTILEKLLDLKIYIGAGIAAVLLLGGLTMLLFRGQKIV